MGRKRRALLFPNTNTLSHFTRALSVAEWLDAHGFEAHIGLSYSRRFWAARFYNRCHRISELWEPSGIPFPCLKWFSNKNHIQKCIESQEVLIREIKPDVIIAVFDFVSAVTSGNIPRISINGYCMLPIYHGVLGFDEQQSPERDEQKRIFENFWSFSAQPFIEPLYARNKPSVKHANELLVGDINCIYEIDAICCPQMERDTYRFVGPIIWDGWDSLGEIPPWRHEPDKLTLYLNFGTLAKDKKMMNMLIRRCVSIGARVLVSSGMKGLIETSDTVFCRPFISPRYATEISDIVVCTGGVGSCYSNLLHGIPSLVIPTQPEQATNGLKMQRAGCGRILTHNVIFIGDLQQFNRAFDFAGFCTILNEMVTQVRNNQFTRLPEIQQIVQQYPTRELIREAVNEVV